MPTSILIVDDHQIIRQGLRSLLEGQDAFEVVAEAVDGRDAVKLNKKLRPRVVIMDIGMPGMNGVEATRQIMHDSPSARVVALSMHSDATYVGRMLKAGVCAYVLKESAFEELSTAIQEVLRNRIYLSPSITGAVVEEYVKNVSFEQATKRSGTLTPKEREVLQLVAEGNSTKEIAANLHVSVKTIDTHRQNIMNRLGIRTVAQLTKFAIREGLTSLDS